MRTVPGLTAGLMAGLEPAVVVPVVPWEVSWLMVIRAWSLSFSFLCASPLLRSGPLGRVPVFRSGMLFGLERVEEAEGEEDMVQRGFQNEPSMLRGRSQKWRGPSIQFVKEETEEKVRLRLQQSEAMERGGRGEGGLTNKGEDAWKEWRQPFR